MAKVIVFHYSEKGILPKLSKDEVNGVLTKLYDELKSYPDVKFNGTFVDEKGRGICDWEAPNVEVVSKTITKVLGAPPADGLIEVKRVL